MLVYYCVIGSTEPKTATLVTGATLEELIEQEELDPERSYLVNGKDASSDTVLTESAFVTVGKRLSGAN